MRRTFSRAALLGAATCIFVAPQAFADCGAVSGSAHVADPNNFSPPRRYDMVTAAKAKAVGAWKSQVSANCPGSSTSWISARRKSISCEGYAGGTACTATARPGD